uniref:Tumor susceptibility 101 n=1 Tax=Hirondellea gigas TaxID=1518452 RepID=A0A6A7G8H7_9CRUS
MPSVEDLLRPLSYKEKPLVQRAVDNCIFQVPSLRAEVSSFVSNTGAQSRLLHLIGTIPISFHGNRYNIPVTIWLDETYPARPPICYVTPTHDMRIKPQHQHVDTQGMIYLSYLHQWNRNGSDLVDLIEVMSSVFGQDPPVFRRAKDGGAKPAPEPVVDPRPVEEHKESIQPGEQPSEEVILAKLREAVVRKLQAALQTRNNRITNQMNQLFDSAARLKDGSAQLSTRMADMEEEKGRLEKFISELNSRNDEVLTWVEQNEQPQNDVDPSAIVKAGDTWSEQLFELVSEDLAIDDTLYELDNAIGNEQIPLNSFINLTRRLARDQFFLRALIRKIFEKLSVPRAVGEVAAVSHPQGPQFAR